MILANTAKVSSPDEPLILVDADDNPIGHRSKLECHTGPGTRHRAFSLFVANARGELLLQQRSSSKPLWPLYWSNTCCSHPRRGETMEQAVHRRLDEELGMRAELRFLYKFEYQASYEDVGSEHEICWVYTGSSHDAVRANANEVAQWRFVTPAELDEELAAEPHKFTPWLKLEWAELRARGVFAVTTGAAAQEQLQ